MPVEPFRVLVIDDDANLRVLLKLLFEHEGYQVLLAPDGEIGLTLAEGGSPDVILLDVAMPHRSGLEVYLDLQNNPRTAGIPVLVCSAALTQLEARRWYTLPNVLEVIAKPFDINALMQRIELICRSQLAPQA
ncbi:MAG TPA: response regulator [Kouleothrix sp.]|uniref:response regulator n=1 Tax=Kouleothrix sp. TaxID=2779161 RepID=UPI002B9C9500|nr:response regulator [Kouleothrix sp.]